jgi:arylsulfatase
MAGEFQGKISRDVRDSKADWDAFLDKRAPK